MKLIVANWKMHKTIEESLDYFKKFEPLIRGLPAYLAVPFTAIQPLATLAHSTSILIGAQNMNDAEAGAFTGEISARMLKEAGARFVILGHSERRHLFHESDPFINKKLKRALADNLQPILCIGETAQERAAGATASTLRRQIQEGLAGIDNFNNLILAYEPVWAIGAQAATPEVIQETHQICRDALKAPNPILYGGAVNLDNAHALLSQPNVDGLLVGGASLSAETFAKIVHLAQNRPIIKN